MVVQHLNKAFRDMNEKSGELVVVKKAGGSIIERPALFSNAGKNVFVVWGNSIRSYNVETAKLINIYHGLSKDAVGVCLHPRDPDKLIAVSSIGEFIEWECSSRGTYIRKVQLDKHAGDFLVQSFSLLTQLNEESLCVVCVAAFPGQNRAFVRTFCSFTGKERNIFGKIRVDNHNRSLAVRHFDGETLLSAFGNKPKTTITFCVSYNESETKIIQTASRNPVTCIACHPTELCVITGDVTGCVKVWNNLLRKPMHTVYHWHTLPVQTLVFSDSGSYFYSGGGECVLVRWLFESPSQNRFLPRLPSEIAYVTVSPGNVWIAVSTRDNGIHLVNSSLYVVSTIQHFCYSSGPSAGKNLLPVEMTSDPRTNALVINGLVGHLQFFSVDQGNLLSLLDVVGRNYLTQERNKTIKNTDLIKFAFSGDGIWLASVEYCEIEEKVPMELRLKFWEYNKEKQKYVLNTSIENPHRGKLNAIQFRPSANNETPMCVTTGEDYKFRTWTLEESTNIYRKGYVWNSENIGFYRDLPVGALSFSNDGSLMAIAFGPTLTVWTPGSNQLKCSLTRPDTVELLSHIEFGRRSCVHLVVTGSKSGIAVWNLLSVSLLWVVHFNLTVLVSDPISDTMAAFNNNNDVVIFSPNCPDPIFKKNCLMPCEECRIGNAVFVPHTRQKTSSVSWQSGSQLYFFNSKQELLCLEHCTSLAESEEGRSLDVLPTESFGPKTAYSALMAHHSKTDAVVAKKEQHKHHGIPGFKTLRQLVEAPAHAMPPLSVVGYSLLLSFISKDDRSDDSRSRFRIPDEDKMMEINDGSDVDEEEDRKEETPSTSNLEERKQNFLRKHQTIATPSKLADTEQCLQQIQKKPLDWVSDLLT